MERTIRVTGKGKISVTPDIVRLIITQSRVKPLYEDAIKESAVQKNELTEELSKLGFDKKDLKTLHFDVDTETEGYRDKNGDWQHRMVGYRFTHKMKLEFSVESNLLGRVLGLLAACTGNPEFSIQYTVSDPEAAKNELLAKAVEDSEEKAFILSKAAGVELGEILTVDYSWGEVELVSRPMNDEMFRGASLLNCCESNIDIDIEADDIDVTDSVTVIWGIK